MLVGREPAKMRPSKDLTTCGRSVLFRPGSSSVMAGCPPGSGGSCPVGRRGVRDCSRAPLVTRLGGQAVRGQRNRTRYPHSDALSTSGGPVRPAPHPGGPAAGRPRSRAALMMPTSRLLWGCHAAQSERERNDVVPQLVVSRVSSLIFQCPPTSTTVTRTVCVHDCAPAGVTWQPEPSGAGLLPLFTDSTTYCPKTTSVAVSCALLTCLRPTSSTSYRVVADTCS